MYTFTPLTYPNYLPRIPAYYPPYTPHVPLYPPSIPVTGYGDDIIALGNDPLQQEGDFFRRIARLKQMAQRRRLSGDRGIIPQYPILLPPPNGLGFSPDWATQPLDQFLNDALRINQAIDAARGRKPAPADPGKGTTNQNAKLLVRAHRYYNYEKGKYINVASVRIHEKGNYAGKGKSRRVTEWNKGGLYEFDASKDDAQVGKTYQVTVTWEDGTSRTWDYTLDSPQGLTVDVYNPWS